MLPEIKDDVIYEIYKVREQGPTALFHTLVLCYWLGGFYENFAVQVKIDRGNPKIKVGDHSAYLLEFLRVWEGHYVPPDLDQAALKHLASFYPRPRPPEFAKKYEENFISSLLPRQVNRTTAETLIAEGRSDLARLLVEHWQQEAATRSNIPHYEKYLWARVAAYMGDKDLARTIHSTLSEKERNPDDEMELNYVITLGQFYKTDDPTHLVARSAAIRRMGKPAYRLGLQRTMLRGLFMSEASDLIPLVLDHIRETCLDSAWTFKYRLRLESLIYVLWAAPEKYRRDIYHFIVALLFDEAITCNMLRIEPGHGLITLEAMMPLARAWSSNDDIQRIIAEVQAQAACCADDSTSST